MRKKEQARGESIGERSKGRGEMDVGERGEGEELEREERIGKEWKRIGRIEKSVRFS